MILKEIELAGFKSFANKSVLKFSFPIVAVVGPNGSGKSNVAEAFRFVLGEQSKKNLRSKSAEDLIWAGNKLKARQNRARVSILFDNSNKDFDIDFDELRIERVIYRDGASEYYINDSQVRLKDVQEVLASAKLGASSHHIISQGEADAILNASDKDRLAMIKDALGLNKYLIKLSDARRKNAKTEENIKEVKYRIRELMPQLSFLEGQIKKKEEIDILKEELARAYANYIYFEKQKLAKEREKLTLELGRLKNAYESAKSALEVFKNSAKDDLLQRLKNSATTLSSKLRELQNKLSVLESQEAELRGKKQVLTRMLYDESDTNNVKQEKKRLVKVPIDFLRELLSFLESKEKESKDNLIKKLREFINSAKSESNTENNRENVKDELQRIEDSMKLLQKEALTLRQEIESVKSELADLESRISERQSGKKSREDKLLDLSDKKSFALNAYKNTELQILDLKKKEESLMSMLNDAKLFSGARFLRKLSELQAGEQKLDKIYSRMDIERLRIKLEELGDIDDDTIREYKNVKEKIEFLKNELDDLNLAREKLKKVSFELEERLAREIKKGIDKISAEFQNFFKILFSGGSASLSLYEFENKDSEKEEALSINVAIPGKRSANIDSLSGGERSLISIALIFAISQVTPPPFIILDETDAALDEANSRKYSEILMQLARNSQIITITHNRQTMSVAGELYGVTMGKDAVSQVLSVSLKEAESVAK